MVMFEATVDRFVKSVGRDLYKPVPNLAQSDNCKPLGIVIKKKKRFFWQSNKYLVEDFQLNDLLTDTSDLGLAKNDRHLVTYNRTSVFSINTHIGGQLKTIFDIELKGEDHVAIEANLGVVHSTEVDTQDLLTKLQLRKLNLNHELVKQVRNNSRLVLCVIVNTAYTTAEATLHAKKDWDVSDEDKVDLQSLKDQKDSSVDADVGGDVKNSEEKSFKIPQNTALAYQALELLVTGSGNIELCLVQGTEGGFDHISQDAVDGPVVSAPTLESGNEQDHIRTRVKPILSMANRADFTAAILDVMRKSSAIKPLKKLIKGQVISVPSEDSAVVNQVLSSLGFETKDGQLVAPSTPSSLQGSASYLFDALSEMDQGYLINLSKIDSTKALSLLDILMQAVSEKTKISGSSVDDLFASHNHAQQVLIDMGFTKDVKELTAPSGLSAYADIYIAAIVCCCLWGDPM